MATVSSHDMRLFGLKILSTSCKTFSGSGRCPICTAAVGELAVACAFDGCDVDVRQSLFGGGGEAQTSSARLLGNGCAMAALAAAGA